MISERINIKPLSVNDAWKGRRYRTDQYKNWTRTFSVYSKKEECFPGPLSIKITFGFSSSGSDIDNPLKPLLDCLQRQKGFNDNQISELYVKKVKVSKGCEYIDYSISPFIENVTEKYANQIINALD